MLPNLGQLLLHDVADTMGFYSPTDAELAHEQDLVDPITLESPIVTERGACGLLGERLLSNGVEGCDFVKVCATCCSGGCQCVAYFVSGSVCADFRDHLCHNQGDVSP